MKIITCINNYTNKSFQIESKILLFYSVIKDTPLEECVQKYISFSHRFNNFILKEECSIILLKIKNTNIYLIWVSQRRDIKSVHFYSCHEVYVNDNYELNYTNNSVPSLTIEGIVKMNEVEYSTLLLANIS